MLESLIGELQVSHVTSALRANESLKFFQLLRRPVVKVSINETEMDRNVEMFFFFFLFS